jgi:tRNA (guanosine-2'-O-)-methyltransferase
MYPGGIGQAAGWSKHRRKRRLTPERRQRLDAVLSRRQPDLTVLAENLHKPRNFSALIRTCDAVGIQRVHAVPGETHPRKHWHTSQGAEKWVELQCHESTTMAVEWLRARGFQMIAGHLADDAVDYREVDYTRPTALLIGTELFGVSDPAVALADRLIHIPMLGMSQSLNVSVACAVVLYEAQRQRQSAGMYEGGPHLDQATHERLRFEWLHPKLAEFCRERDLDYPALDEDGDLLEALPRG